MELQNSKIRKIISLVAMIGICSTIFFFSSQIAETSSGTSGRVVKVITELIPPIKKLPEPEKTKLQSEIMQPIVRKMAHFSIYAVLGIVTMNYALTCKRNFYQRGLLSIVFGMLYAMSDEFHQLFVQGRSGEIRDVCIDTLGVITGVLFVIFITKQYRKKRQIKEKNDLQKDTKVIFISSTGGHFSELMQLKPIMEKCNYHIVTEKTKSNQNLKQKYGNKINFLIYGTKRTPVHYAFILLANCFISLAIYLKERPHFIITTGTHTAGPMCCIARLLGSKVIYIETYANRKTKTQTGKWLYFIANIFIVQWEDMLEIYPKAIYLGSVY